MALGGPGFQDPQPGGGFVPARPRYHLRPAWPKPSRQVRIQDVVVVKKDQMTRTFKVLQLLEQRVGGAAAKEYAEDQTPASEWEKPREPSYRPFVRPKGSGRPTKKERRQLDAMSVNGPAVSGRS